MFTLIASNTHFYSDLIAALGEMKITSAWRLHARVKIVPYSSRSSGNRQKFFSIDRVQRRTFCVFHNDYDRVTLLNL